MKWYLNNSNFVDMNDHFKTLVLMKKIYILILAAMLTGFSNHLFAQARRFPLIEHFTQASCSPCAQQNPFLQAVLDVNRGAVNHIAYHTSWPGVDPMNAYNPTEVADRVSYYGVNGVPDCSVCVSVNSQPPSIWLRIPPWFIKCRPLPNGNWYVRTLTKRWVVSKLVRAFSRPRL